MKYVYLFLLDDLHKIGFSGSPSVRLQQVAPGGTIVHLIPSAHPRQVEATLHRRFKSKCVESEWFALDEDDVALILTVGRCDTMDDLPVSLQARVETTTHRTKDLQPVSFDLPNDVAESIRDLARKNGRPLREEIEHALRRHLVQPPSVSVLVVAPPLAPAEIVRGKRGRPRKVAQKGVAT